MSGNIKVFDKKEEERVRDFWKREGIAEKVRLKQKTGSGVGKFYFMDGPPYATGHIHMGTALNKIMKDCAIRSQRMQGKKIFDRPGFDTHGLPIENKVEKKLGFKAKKDILDFGVENFIKACKEFATEFVDTMGEEFDNLADWMDYSNPYLTFKDEYIEAIWFAFKKAEEKNLLYLGKYPVHICPHCETAVAFNEIVYQKLLDTAIFVRLKITDESIKEKGLPNNSYLLIWTTTPWTLPANTGVMVHPFFEYAQVRLSNGETWIIAKEKVEELMNAFGFGYTFGGSMQGKELEGVKYVPLFDGVLPKSEVDKAFRVILSDRFVNLIDGSGLVHVAPGHGKEDYDAGTRAGLPVLSPVGLDGVFSVDVKKYAGKKARETNDEIVEDLSNNGFLVYKHQYSHDYPFCWRCDSPLLMISVPQWFLSVSKIREKMLADNEQVNWVPSWMKVRMKNWIENLNDWPVSRARYWGTPLPIWVCDKCNEREVFGSVEELKKASGLDKIPELHKPYIDEVTFDCKKCGGRMKRVSEVLDVWFDSGVSSWANLGYPQNNELFNEFWPADLNIEMTEQVRGWWNSQSILSTICFGKLPYKAISVHGMVRDLGHQKMSKSKGNAISPEQVISEYSRDYLRTYLLLQSKGFDFNFDIKGVGELKSFFNLLANSLNYAKIYLTIDVSKNIEEQSLLPEDLWMLSRVEALSNEVLGDFNGYEFSRAVVAIQNFVDKEFSRTYLKLIRSRLGTETQKQVDEVVSFTINVFLRLLAPIAPHVAEHYFQEFDGPKQLGVESIHLLEFIVPSGFRNEALEKEFDFVSIVSQAALALRSEQKLRIRWQLEELVLASEQKVSILQNSLKKMVNVKKFVSIPEGEEPIGTGFVSKDFGKGKIFLKTDASNQLREEWELSELLRLIQDARKKAGLSKGQIVELAFECSDKEFLNKFREKIEEKTSTQIKIVSGQKLEKLVDREFFYELKV